MRPARYHTRMFPWLWAIAMVLVWVPFAHAHVERGPGGGIRARLRAPLVRA